MELVRWTILLLRRVILKVLGAAKRRLWFTFQCIFFVFEGLLFIHFSNSHFVLKLILTTIFNQNQSNSSILENILITQFELLFRSNFWTAFFACIFHWVDIKWISSFWNKVLVFNVERLVIFDFITSLWSNEAVSWARILSNVAHAFTSSLLRSS